MTATTQTFEIDSRPVVVRPIAGDDDARACAEIMATSEPWITLGRTTERGLEIIADRDTHEIYVATHDGEVVGLLILVMKGALVGYIRSVGVRADWRSHGLGSRLMAFAEERIFREFPNAFICVSSFNPRARALYERLGYEAIGELRDFIVRGHSEWLMRKSTGPLSGAATSALRDAAV